MVLFYANSTDKNVSFSLTNYFSGNYYSYSKEKINNNSINLGFCYLNKNIKSNDIIGESITTNNLELGSTIKQLNAKVVKTEYLENGITVIYTYTPLIKDNVCINNEKVNLQFAIKNETITIGWPLILGSF